MSKFDVLSNLFDFAYDDQNDLVLESKLIPSQSFYKAMTLRQVNELIHLYLITLEILRKEADYAVIARSYARNTVRYRNFHMFRYGQTDLYALLHVLYDPKQNIKRQLRHPQMTNHIESRMMLDANFENLLMQYLLQMSRGQDNYSLQNRFLLIVEKALHITEMDYRAIRRLAVDWTRLNPKQKSLAITRLLQAYYRKGYRSELLPILKQLSEDQNLEIRNANNPEEPKKDSGIASSMQMGEPPTNSSEPNYSPNTQNQGGSRFGFLKGLLPVAALGGGIAAGYYAADRLRKV